MSAPPRPAYPHAAPVATRSPSPRSGRRRAGRIRRESSIGACARPARSSRVSWLGWVRRLDDSVIRIVITQRIIGHGYRCGDTTYNVFSRLTCMWCTWVLTLPQVKGLWRSNGAAVQDVEPKTADPWPSRQRRARCLSGRDARGGPGGGPEEPPDGCPGTRSPLGDATMSLLLRRFGIPCVPHGMRSSFRDWCSETGVRREVAEAALAHVVKNRVEAAYARSDLLESRREVMERWGEYLANGVGAHG